MGNIELKGKRIITNEEGKFILVNLHDARVSYNKTPFKKVISEVMTDEDTAIFLLDKVSKDIPKLLIKPIQINVVYGLLSRFLSEVDSCNTVGTVIYFEKCILNYMYNDFDIDKYYENKEIYMDSLEKKIKEDFIVIEDGNLSEELNKIFKSRNINLQSIEDLQKLIDSGEFRDVDHLEEIITKMEKIRKLGDTDVK